MRRSELEQDAEKVAQSLKRLTPYEAVIVLRTIRVNVRVEERQEIKVTGENRKSL